METKHFIKTRITDDVAAGRTPKVVLRFPPEPNGYLHLGHVKSIVLNSSLAEEFDGELNLRFDDTNPKKESTEYVEAIRRDAAWLSDRFTRVLWTSDYFDDIHRAAVHLVRKGLAYVDDSTPEEMRAMRGDFGRPGTESPARARTPAENEALFDKMRYGEFAEGACVLRARIDMAHPNLNMRDPALYRISFAEHHNTGSTWCIYPMYDFAHPVSDALEGITHSLCTLEFEDHRPLYDWVIEHCHEVLGARPVQIEFSRLDVEGVVLSKRKLNALVEDKLVSGWDSPAMPTVAGLRRRGFTAEILREFVMRCGFTKVNSTVSASVLEDCVCDVLGPSVERRMAIVDPVELIIENLAEPLTVELPNHPKDASKGVRTRTLTSRIFVERDDVRTAAEEGFWRIFPGNWVRLKHGVNLFIKAVEASDARATRVIAEADLGSRNPKEAKHKAKAMLHWLSDVDGVEKPAAFYPPLFDSNGEFNERCITRRMILTDKEMTAGTSYEFERVGYFHVTEEVVHNLAPLKVRSTRG
jgi:glutaminyl-tRNA synthetase